MNWLHSTPDDGNSGPKFTFEAQTNSYDTSSQTPDIKESPPSSPASEASQQRGHKRHTNSNNTSTTSSSITNNSNSNSSQPPSSATDAKDFKMFQKNSAAQVSHQLMGNQLNPASSMAQKMTDQLYMEMDSVYNTATSLEATASLIGPTFPGKQLNNVSTIVAHMNVYKVGGKSNGVNILCSASQQSAHSTAGAIVGLHIGWYCTTNG